MERYLVTTAISEFWELEKGLLLLGPWCFTEKNRKLLEGRDYMLIESPWRPFGPKIKEAADYCHNIYEKILPEIGKALNDLHSVSYPERYWRVLLGPWLLHFVGVLYERYVRIQHALELYPDLYTHCLDGDCEISSNATQDFVNKVCEDEYNLKLFSLICTYVGVAHKKIGTLPPQGVSYSPPDSPPLRALLSGVKKMAEKSLASLANGPIALVDMYHLRPKDYLLLSLKTGYRLCHSGKFHGDIARFGYSPDMRAGFTINCQGSDSFTRLLSKVLPSAIPRCYIEGFNFYRRNSPTLNGVKVVGSAVGWYFNEVFKFSAAEAVAKGARLVDFQYGGGWGNYLVVPPEDVSLEKDVFYTWGWNSRATHGEKLAVLPSPHLSRLRDSYSYSINKILYIGTGLPRYHFRFHSYDLPEEFVSYLEDMREFLKNLPVGLKSYILYRPFLHEYGWGIKEIIKDVCPEAELLRDVGLIGRLTDWMRKVRVCVIDHPSTSFIEALAINVPCIFFWDHEVYVMRPEAEEYFELLRKAGILYKTPEEAVRKLIKVFDDPWTWWKSKEVQEARQTFLERFGYSRKDWMEYWAKEIGLLASGRRITCPQKR